MNKPKALAPFMEFCSNRGLEPKRYESLQQYKKERNAGVLLLMWRYLLNGKMSR